MASNERPRALTDLEVRYLWSALALSGEPESIRIRQSELPRSTYHSIRTRALSQGWVTERYVPDPSRLGRTRVRFALAASMTALGPLPARWEKDPSAAVVWEGSRLAFGVFFPPSNGPAPGKTDARTASAPGVLVESPTDPDSVPIYFDYEGLWAHVVGASGVVRYPAPLSLPLARPPVITARERAALPSLLSQGAFQRTLLSSDRQTRRLLDKQVVRMRTFLNPGALPGYLDRSLDYALFVHGRLKLGTPQELLGLLTAKFHIYPFLFVTVGGEVLLGALGQANRAWPRNEGESVREGLVNRLDKMTTVAEPLSDLRAVLDHRYTSFASP